MAYCILGKGLIGKALIDKLEAVEYPNEHCEAIIDLASPTHLTFQENINYHLNQSIDRLLTLLPFCKQHNILYVFPSSALVYEKDMPFVHAKRAAEEIIRAYGVRYLILRIWPTYGDEGHKGDKASVIYKWTQQIKNGETIEVYGDGEQRRAFISADEVADKVIKAIQDGKEGTYDIAGEEKSFNQILKELGATNVKYVPAPAGYSLISPHARTPL